MIEMTTPFLRNHLLFSCGDHPGKVSFITYTDVSKCNLKCKNCHNRETAKKNNEVFSFLSLNDFEKNFKNGVLMGSDILVISGGEPTLETKHILEVLSKLQKQIPVRIDTNGQLPNEVARLLNFVDGFAVDIKIPIKNYYSEEETKRFQKILGIYDITGYVRKLKETIKLVDGMDLTLFRTVEYPELGAEDRTCINHLVSGLKSKHYWNPYFEEVI